MLREYIHPAMTILFRSIIDENGVWYVKPTTNYTPAKTDDCAYLWDTAAQFYLWVGGLDRASPIGVFPYLSTAI
jgi:hypothetical protein